jgi:hypothetical protein
MRKLPLQDVVSKPEDRSVNTGVMDRNASPRGVVRAVPELDSGKRAPHQNPQRKGGGRGKVFLWTAIFAAVIVVAFVSSVIFAAAEVLVTPEEQNIFVSGSFNALPVDSADLLEAIPYSTLDFTKTASKTVPASGTEEVEEHSRGTITVYNNFGKASQRLIANTRFETADGLIFRIRDSIVVPGQGVGASGTTVPGSFEVVVYADEPGETYNIGPTEFTIPGFSGSPRFEAFSAESKSPMSGGFKGKKRVATAESIEQTKLELREELRELAVKSLETDAPDGYIAPEGGIKITFSSMPTAPDGENGVTLSEEARVTAVLFPLDILSERIARDAIPGFEGNPIRIANINQAEISFDDTARVDAGLAFTVEGSLLFRAIIDADSLINDLLGKDKDALPTILGGYPGIKQAEIIMRPFWKGSFPNEATDIRVTIQIGEDK